MTETASGRGKVVLQEGEGEKKCKRHDTVSGDYIQAQGSRGETKKPNPTKSAQHPTKKPPSGSWENVKGRGLVAK